MTGRELSRRSREDGMTEVTVALGADRQGIIIVPTSMVDGPGYQDMLDIHAAKHGRLISIRDGEVPQ